MGYGMHNTHTYAHTVNSGYSSGQTVLQSVNSNRTHTGVQEASDIRTHPFAISVGGGCKGLTPSSFI